MIRSTLPVKIFFFICYLTVSQFTLGHYRGEILTHPMLITTFSQFSTRRSSISSSQGWIPKLGRAPQKSSSSICTLNPPGHSPQILIVSKMQKFKLFHDGRVFYIETSLLICSICCGNQWTGFYMSVMKVKFRVTFSNQKSVIIVSFVRKTKTIEKK